MQPDRWVGVGSCAGAREQSGARAVDDALIHDDPKLLIVFCSQAHDLGTLLRQIRGRAGDVPLIGCTTAGEIATSGPNDASVVVTALGKHAKASSVLVEADVTSDVLRLDIRDNGRGGADPARGSGLIGLKDRAEAIGGTFTMQSRRGEGTRLLVELPASP
jgi:hypothetical protein